jgi:hypothetical protein
MKFNIPEANREQEFGKGQDLARHVALEVLVLIVVVFLIAVSCVMGDSECP